MVVFDGTIEKDHIRPRRRASGGTVEGGRHGITGDVAQAVDVRGYEGGYGDPAEDEERAGEARAWPPACGGGWKFGSARKVEGRVEDDDEDGDDDEDEGGEEDDDAEDEEGSPLEEVLCMGMFGGFSVELLPVLLE